LRRLLRRNSHG